MKSKNFSVKTMIKLTGCILFLVTLLLFLTGCGASSEEEIIITDYENGVYEPQDDHYIFTSPSEDWVIDGEENSKDILFIYKNNAIQIRHFLDDNADEIIKELPQEQIELEENLKADGYSDCQVEAFSSTASYENNIFSGEINYAYLDYETGFYVLERDIYVENELFMLSAQADSNSYLTVQNALNQFEILDDESAKSSQVPDIEIDTTNNTYTSYDGMYTIKLPYEEWEFAVDEEKGETVITSENKSIMISEIDSLDKNNSIEYEVPRTLSSLKKQIEINGFKDYELNSFYEITVDTVRDLEEKSNYRKFYYLLKLNNDPDGYTYCSIYEYRSEYSTYKIIGKTNSPYTVDSKKILEISNSFDAE